MNPGPSPARAPRKDALRNDRRVLEAAREVFFERGTNASMEEIAERAGIGVGTIYRRFAGKEALLDAIAALVVDQMDQAAAAALTDPDPGHGLKTFLEFVGELNAEKRRYAASLVDRLTGQGAGDPTARKIDELTLKAVAAGALAPTVTPEDIRTLIVALRTVVGAAPDGNDGQWRRFLHLHLAGLGMASD